MNAAQMMEDPRSCYLLWGIEPDFDIDDPARAMNALRQADKVIAVASYASQSLREVSDVILPLAPIAETEGSLFNLDGTGMSVRAAGKAPGEAKPGWKILRRLGSKLGLEGFSQVSVEEVSAEFLAESDNAGIKPAEPDLASTNYADSLYRIGEIPMYSVDAVCRRSLPLQETAQARNEFLGLNPEDAARLGLAEGGKARVRQGEHDVELDVSISDSVPAGGALIRSASSASCELGPAVAPVIVEVA
jgi:NADH-quinone oxidoreductase subunit G